MALEIEDGDIKWHNSANNEIVSVHEIIKGSAHSTPILKWFGYPTYL